jgi:hypothetical protein
MLFVNPSIRYDNIFQEEKSEICLKNIKLFSQKDILDFLSVFKEFSNEFDRLNDIYKSLSYIDKKELTTEKMFKLFQSKSEHLKISINIGLISCSLVYKNKEYSTNLYIYTMKNLQVSFKLSEDLYSETYKEYFSIIL